VQVAVDDGGLQVFGERLRLFHATGHDDAAAGHDHRELGVGEKLRRLIEALLGAGPARDTLRAGDPAVDLAVEIVARDVELRGLALGQRHVAAAPRELGHAGRVVHVPLVLGNLGEDRQLIGLLEATEPHAHRAGLGRDYDNR
jgi:hypothetical protein